MNERRQRLEAVFHGATELGSVAERERYLTEACGGDPELRREVDELLRSAEGADVVFQAGREACRGAGVIPVLPSTEGPGMRIGRYKLLQQIGEGGMGVVYLAEQEEPVRRRVAFKVIKLGMDTKQVVARFEAERQALALMDHPNIARVLDGGVTKTGRPYFVMELVQGVPITEFCEKSNLPTEQRLKLFVQVCQAIQSAHNKGIIHRDIKPSNVMVTLRDGVPVPKVIDFGVAKATNQRLTEKTLFTHFASMIGTPAYMSPEQAEMSSVDVDTRSDIYSLGVLLYALLTGTTPFSEKRLRSLGYGEIQRIIREEEPERPSTRLSTMAKEQKSMIAKNRREALASFSNRLKGDLDWIVMKCLEKDRQRRYETASGLASDIQRHLGDEPVVARPPSAAYRIQKLAQRNKLAFIASGTVFAVLVLGIIVSVGQAVRATRAENEQTHLRILEAQLRANVQAQMLVARQRAYASDMNQAQQALAVNNLGRAQMLLNRQQPEKGDRDLRGWEWRYLWQQCQSDASFHLCQKTSSIESLAVSPDGKWLAIGEQENGNLWLWDLSTRREIARLPSGKGEVRVAFSPQRSLLAHTFETGVSNSTNYQSGVRLWDGETQQTVATLPLAAPICGLAFSSDGQRLAASTVAPDNRITIFRVADGNILGTYSAPQLAGEATAGTSFTMAGDFSISATGSDQSRVHVINPATGRERWSRIASEAFVTALALSPDSRTLASGAGWTDSDIRLWDAASGAQLGLLAGHRGWVSAILFWPDGKTMASASADQTIGLWDVGDLTHPRLLRVMRGHKLEVWRLALLPDNSTLVSGSKDGSVYLWDTRKRSRPPSSVTLPARLAAWRFAPEGDSLISVDTSGRVEKWTGTNFQQRATLMETRVPCSYEHTQISRDCRYVAVTPRNGVVQVWDLRTQIQIREFRASTEEVIPIEFLVKRESLAIRHAGDGVLDEWSLVSGVKTQSWQGEPNSWELGCAFSPDEGQCITLALYGGKARLHDLNTRRDVSLDLNLNQAYRAEFSPDGRFFVASSALGSAQLWKTDTYKTVATFSGFLLGVRSAVFSPDGKRLAITSDGKEAIKIWDLESHQELLTLGGQGSDFRPTAFSPDGHTIGAMNVRNGILQLWRAPSWSEIEAARSQTNERWPGNE